MRSESSAAGRLNKIKVETYPLGFNNKVIIDLGESNFREMVERIENEE